MKKIFFLVFFFSSSQLSGQRADSLHSLLLKETSEVSKVEILDQISRHYTSLDLDSALIYCDSSFAVFNRLEKNIPESDILFASLLWRKGMIMHGFGNFNEAKEFYQKSIKLYDEVGERINVKEVRLNELAVLIELRDTTFRRKLLTLESLLDTAKISPDKEILYLLIYFKARQREKEEDYSGAAAILINLLDYQDANSRKNRNFGTYNTIGGYLEKAFDFTSAKKYYLKAIKVDGLKGHQYSKISVNIASMHFRRMELDSAIHYVKLAKSFNNLLPYNHFLADKLLAEIYIEKGAFEEALINVDKCQLIANESKNQKDLNDLKINQATIFFHQGKYKESEILFGEIFSYIKKHPKQISLRGKKNVFEKFLELKLIQRNTILKSKIFSEYKSVRDSIEKKVAQSKVAELSTRYQTEKKETENLRLLKEKKLNSTIIRQQKIVIGGSIFLLLLITWIASLFFKRNKEKKRSNIILQDKNDKIETLHKELLHRMKNNLAFVSGMLSMQARRLKNDEAKEAIQEGEFRIEAMSILHQKIYSHHENSLVNIGEYLKEIIANLQNAFPTKGVRPKLIFDIESTSVEGESAMRIGLIINELVTNSFKYAFENINFPAIKIQLSKVDSNTLQLIYADNGVGFSSKINIEKSNSMGLKLINLLTKQLKGDLKIENKEGACFKFELPYLILERG